MLIFIVVDKKYKQSIQDKSTGRSYGASFLVNQFFLLTVNPNGIKHTPLEVSY